MDNAKSATDRLSSEAPKRDRMSARFKDALNNPVSGDPLAHLDVAERLYNKMYHDRLTGLLNRDGLFSQVEALQLQLSQEAEDSTRIDSAGLPDACLNGETLPEQEQGLLDEGVELVTQDEQSMENVPDNLLALIYLDLNKFSEINNTFGHDVGDKVLRDFSTELSACLRIEDLVARWGGDEFVIVMQLHHNFSGIKPDDIRLYIENELKKRIRRGVKAGNEHLGLASAAIGVCIGTADDLGELDKMMKMADEEMYTHKRYIDTSKARTRVRMIARMISEGVASENELKTLH